MALDVHVNIVLLLLINKQFFIQANGRSWWLENEKVSEGGAQTSMPFMYISIHIFARIICLQKLHVTIFFNIPNFLCEFEFHTEANKRCIYASVLLLH